MNLKRCDQCLLVCLILAAFLTDLVSGQKNSTKSKQRDKSSKKGKESKESAPYYSFAAWNNRGKICLLVKLDATFKITYEASYGEQSLTHHLPMDAEMNGRCANVLDTESVMDITWKGGFIFRIVFQKYPKYDTWGVKKMELLYNTGDALFDGVAKGQERIAKIESEFILAQFETPLGRSYLCPSPDVLYLQDAETGEKNVILRLTNIQMQAFDITAGKFSPVLRCGQVGFGLGVATPFGMAEGDSDGVQMTVFTITVLSSISTVLGYALYRSFFVKSYDYQESAI